MERKLASVQTIAALEPISGADNIERATILGWHCVVKKGEFSVGDLCVYFEVDSLLPDKPEFEFMACRKYRVRTIKLRGQVSQGLAMHPSELKSFDLRKVKEGQDLTEKLGVLKYETNQTSEPRVKRKMTWIGRLVLVFKRLLGLAPKGEGKWPSFLPKTDETRIQNNHHFLQRHAGFDFYVTEKLDGCSCTIYLRNGRFGVCSRNTEIEPKRVYTDQRCYFRPLVEALGIEPKLRALGRNLALQGEVVGPNCNGNKYGLQRHRLYLFNVYDIDSKAYLSKAEAQLVAHSLGLDWCPEVGKMQLVGKTVDELVELSKGKTVLSGAKHIHREGIVVRSEIERYDPVFGRASFKVINPDFLLKFEE